MVTEATKKYREVFAYGLLGVAALYFISGLSLLFKSEEDSGLAFTGRAGAFGYLFAHPLLVIALVGAVALVSGFGEASKNAKAVVLAALGIGGISALFALISWLSAFGADTDTFGPSGIFGGVLLAGKIVGIFLGLAQLIFLGLALFFAWSVFERFPKPVKATQPQQWGQQGGYGQQQGWGQQAPTDAGYGQPQQGWGQNQGWGQQPNPSDPAYGQPQQSWGQDYGAGGPAAAGSTGWGDQSEAQAEHQGHPAANWEGQPAQQTWGQPTEQEQPTWAPPAETQQSWGQPAEPAAEPAEESPYAAPSHASPPPTSEETQAWGEPVADDSAPQPEPAADPAAENAEEKKDDEQPPQQGGWWQQPTP